MAQNVPGATNLWAPDIAYFGGMYHLYYAASTFGSNQSCIGHATKADIATGSWMDQGTVICSNMGTSDNWNAIDPNIVIDDAGTPWMDFGSFWGGVKMIKIDAATGGRATDDMMVYNIADRPQGRGGPEGSWIFKRCGYYYLFESWGACCDGAYDYNMRVGRSTSVNKDYVDKAGLKLQGGGGGTLVVAGEHHRPRARAQRRDRLQQQDLQPVPRAQRVERRRFAAHHRAGVGRRRLARPARSVERPRRVRHAAPGAGALVAADRVHVRVRGRARRRDRHGDVPPPLSVVSCAGSSVTMCV